MNKRMYIIPLLLMYQASVSGWTWKTTGNVTTDWSEKYETMQRERAEQLKKSQQADTVPQPAPRPQVKTVPAAAQQPTHDDTAEIVVLESICVEDEATLEESKEVLKPNTGYSFRTKLAAAGATLMIGSTVLYVYQLYKQS